MPKQKSKSMPDSIQSSIPAKKVKKPAPPMPMANMPMPKKTKGGC